MHLPLLYILLLLYSINLVSSESNSTIFSDKSEPYMNDSLSDRRDVHYSTEIAIGRLAHQFREAVNAMEVRSQQQQREIERLEQRQHKLSRRLGELLNEHKEVQQAEYTKSEDEHKLENERILLLHSELKQQLEYNRELHQHQMEQLRENQLLLRLEHHKMAITLRELQAREYQVEKGGKQRLELQLPNLGEGIERRVDLQWRERQLTHQKGEHHKEHTMTEFRRTQNNEEEQKGKGMKQREQQHYAKERQYQLQLLQHFEPKEEKEREELSKERKQHQYLKQKEHDQQKGQQYKLVDQTVSN